MPGSRPNALPLVPRLDRQPSASQVQLVRLPDAERAAAACVLLSDIPAVRSILAAFLAKRTRDELEGSDSEGEEYRRKRAEAIGSNRPAGPAEPANDDSDFLDKELEGLAGMPDAEPPLLDKPTSEPEPVEAKPLATDQPTDNSPPTDHRCAAARPDPCSKEEGPNQPHERPGPLRRGRTTVRKSIKHHSTIAIELRSRTQTRTRNPAPLISAIHPQAQSTSSHTTCFAQQVRQSPDHHFSGGRPRNCCGRFCAAATW